MPIVSGHDTVARKQLVSFLTDYGVIIAIWAIESNRRNNALTPAQMYASPTNSEPWLTLLQTISVYPTGPTPRNRYSKPPVLHFALCQLAY
jgi:hypothetical protein